MVEQARLREYIYYSDRKIESLAQQLRVSGWRRALDRIEEAGVGGPEATGAKVKTRLPEPTPILQLLQRVWKQLEREKAVGAFDEPNRYLYGRLEFYYAPFDTVDPPVFFLAGATDRTIVGLGGSLKYVRGYRDQEVRAAQNAQRATMEPDVAAVIHASEAGSLDASVESSAVESASGWPTHVAGIYVSWERRKANKLEFEVLAVKEGQSTVAEPFWEAPRHVLIGSPIFVAFT